MSIFHKVTIQSLKKNRVRTIVTIIGIMLSTTMICAVTTFVSSFQNYLLQGSIYNAGDWHGSAFNEEWNTYEDIWVTGEVEDAVYAQQLGYAIAEGCQNEYKPYLYVLGASNDFGSDFKDVMPVHLIAGEFPKSQNEILLPEHLAENGGVYYSIGDNLTLELGTRMSEGYALAQQNPYHAYEDDAGTFVVNEELVAREIRAYTVVGFYERPDFEEYHAPGYTAITIADKSPSVEYLYDIWFKMENPEDVYEFMEEMELSGERNTTVLTYLGVSSYDNFDIMLSGLATIVIGLIMFGSVSLIYNAFSISVSERTKQFGLLSSVGATKKQLRRMVFFEALTVSAIGIPVGIGAGIGGIGITLLLIGNMFESLGAPIPMRISVSVASIVIAVIVALVTVLISAWIPSKRATRISAVESIRQTMDVNAKGKTVKTSKLMYKLFGLPGMLANKNYKRSRKKYRATIISLFMSIVLFVSASAFTDYLMEAAAGGYSTYAYDLEYQEYTGNEPFDSVSKDELLELLSDDAAIKKAAYSQEVYLQGKINKSNLTSEALENSYAVAWFDESDESVETDTDIAKIQTIVTFVNDSAFSELLAEYQLDEERYFDAQNPMGIAVDAKVSRFDYEKEKYVTMNALKVDSCEIYFDLPVEEGHREIVLKADKVIRNLPFFVESGNALVLLYPVSMMQAVMPDMDGNDHSIEYYFTSKDHNASYQAMKRTLNENGFSAQGLYDYAEWVEEERNLVTIITVFSYGFIVLISLIAAANVFNTISTNISLRRREFAMLKSVGMTKKGFNRMMNFECLLYGTKALLYGLPVSVGITYLIFNAVSAGYDTSFHLPLSSIGIAVFSVFAVVFATMMYSMSKIKKDNPIDALKNENL